MSQSNRREFLAQVATPIGFALIADSCGAYHNYNQNELATLLATKKKNLLLKGNLNGGTYLSVYMREFWKSPNRNSDALKIVKNFNPFYHAAYNPNAYDPYAQDSGHELLPDSWDKRISGVDFIAAIYFRSIEESYLSNAVKVTPGDFKADALKQISDDILNKNSQPSMQKALAMHAMLHISQPVAASVINNVVDALVSLGDDIDVSYKLILSSLELALSEQDKGKMVISYANKVKLSGYLNNVEKGLAAAVGSEDAYCKKAFSSDGVSKNDVWRCVDVKNAGLARYKQNGQTGSDTLDMEDFKLRADNIRKIIGVSINTSKSP